MRNNHIISVVRRTLILFLWRFTIVYSQGKIYFAVVNFQCMGLITTVRKCMHLLLTTIVALRLYVTIDHDLSVHCSLTEALSALLDSVWFTSSTSFGISREVAIADQSELLILIIIVLFAWCIWRYRNPVVGSTVINLWAIPLIDVTSKNTLLVIVNVQLLKHDTVVLYSSELFHIKDIFGIIREIIPNDCIL